MSLMLAPVANRSYRTSGGTVYLSDGNGIIANVSTVQDQIDLGAAGCIVLQPPPSNLVAKLLGANFNATTDQAFTLLINSKYRVTKITAENTSVAGMSTAAGGVYTQTGKLGTPLVAAAQVYTGLTNAATALDLTLNEPNAVLPALTPIYFSLTTAHGAAAAADIFVYGDIYPAT